ncbi:MAG TPA: sulfatase-like hydrolase/transferase [Acidimicrobiales bacterium]
MVATDVPASDGSGDGAAPTAAQEPEGRLARWRSRVAPLARLTAPADVRREALPYALELLALSSFVLARPLLASFGRSPESLVARGSDWTDVVAFALVIVLAPVAVLVAAESLLALVAGVRARRLAHSAAMAGLLALVVWELVAPRVPWAFRPMVAVSAAAGLALAAAHARFPALRTFLRYCSLGAVVFVAQFLFMSSTASIVLGGRHAPLAEAEVPANAAPVVMVVFDGLPTGLLLDGEGQIDAELYPNLAGLAGDATWYRNHTTAAQITLEAVPAILSGQRPSAERPPALVSKYPHNIFTLLGRCHEVHGGEAITGLCPVTLCPEEAGSPLGGLLRDAGRIWEQQMTEATVEPELVPYVFDGRLPRSREWIDAQDFRRGERPGLHVLHILLPHPGWEYLPDGGVYGATRGQAGGLWIDTWSGWGHDVARQRHVLQAQTADMLLGQLLDRLRADGAYDHSMVVVTADHGYAFTEGSPMRAVDEGNFDEILWTPLFVKAPGQRVGAIDDSNVNSTDILPTVAAELGIDELPWELDGRPLGTVDRDPADKWVVDWEAGRLRPEGDDEVVRIDGVEGFARVLASDPVEGTGDLAAWRRTEHGGLVGRSVAGEGGDDGRGGVEVGEPLDAVASVEGLDAWANVDVGFPPLELRGQAPLPADALVAVTADGVVAAVVPTTPTVYGVSIIQALLWPGALHGGANEIGLHLVDGPPDAPVLHPLDVVPK